MAIEKRVEQPLTHAIVTPADVDAVLDMIKSFENFKIKVLTDKDFATIQGKPFVMKSGWSKYALVCMVSTEVRDERVEERDGHRIYHFTYRAIHRPSERYAEAVGSASEAERKDWNHPEHDVRTLAQTRACNRAISNLVGGGEISAEEMQTSNRIRQPRKEARSRSVRNDPDKQYQLKLGRIDVNVIAYNLKAIEIGEDDVSISEQDDGFYVEPSKGMDNEDYNRIHATLNDMGAEWLDETQRWVIWKEAEDR